MPHYDLTSSARLEALVRELALPVGRRVGTAGHRVAVEWVTSQLRRQDLDPYSGDRFALPYDCDGKHYTNFAGIIPGRDQSLSPILIGAHYDSVTDAPCDDDNAAAVTLALEVAARIKPDQLRHDDGQEIACHALGAW